MKKTIAAIAFVFVVGLAAPGLADENGWTSDGGLYISGHGLITNLRGTNETGCACGNDYWEYDIGFGGTAAVGYAFVFPGYGVDLRGEIEGSYRKSAHDSISFADGTFWDINGNTTIKAVMVNMLVDVHTQTRLTPYFGAGLGRMEIGYDNWSVTQTDPLGVVTTFGLPTINFDVGAWQAIAGLGFAISPSLIIDLEYRYFQPNDPGFNGLISNDFAFGLRFIF
jgi:opacity protein-like surface antigen